jgi:hypothetical protein
MQETQTNFHLLPFQIIPTRIILGDFMPVERIDLEMESTNMQIISKEERVCLVPTDKSKIHATFIKGINNKLRGADPILGMGEVMTIANVTSFSQLALRYKSILPAFPPIQFSTSFDSTMES